MSYKLSQIEYESFHEKGYVIIRGLYSALDISKFRERTMELLEFSRKNNLSYKSQHAPSLDFIKGDLLSKPKFKEIILDHRVIDIIKALLKKSELYYFGNSAFHIHSDGFRGYHRDNIDRSSVGPDWDEEYTLVRCGLYLQNHDRFSGGLEVIPGSHNSLEKSKFGQAEFVRSKSGDLVIWNMKVLHSGNTLMPKIYYKHPLPINGKRESQFMKLGLIRKEEKDRIALFFSYGGNVNQVRRFIEFTNSYKEDFIEGWKISPINNSILEEAKNVGLEIIPPIPEYIVYK